MHHYLIECPIISAQGRQTWDVNAESEAEASELHKKGKSAFVDEEIEVLDTDKPKIILDD